MKRLILLLAGGLACPSVFAETTTTPNPQMEAFCKQPSMQANRQIGLAQAAQCNLSGNDWKRYYDTTYRGNPYDYFLKQCHTSNPHAVNIELKGLTKKVQACLNDKQKIRQRVSPGKAHYYRLPVTPKTARYKIPGMTKPLDLSRHLKLDSCVIPFLEVNQQGNTLYFKLDTLYNQYSRLERCEFGTGSSMTSSEFWFVKRSNQFCLTKARFYDQEQDQYSEGTQESQERIYNLSALKYSFTSNFLSGSIDNTEGNDYQTDSKKMRPASCIGVDQISISPVIPDPLSFRKESFLHQYVIQ